MSNIEQSRREIQEAFEALLVSAQSQRRRSFFEFETELWTGMLTLGRALVALFLAHQAGRPRPVQYTSEGQRYMLAGARTSQLGTRFGKVSFTRPVARLIADSRRRVDRPIDRELGLCGGFSLATVATLVRLTAMMAFGQARETFKALHEWTPSSRATLRMVDAVGGQARPFLQDAPAPNDDGEILVIQVCRFQKIWPPPFRKIWPPLEGSQGWSQRSMT